MNNVILINMGAGAYGLSDDQVEKLKMNKKAFRYFSDGIELSGSIRDAIYCGLHVTSPQDSVLGTWEVDDLDGRHLALKWSENEWVNR